LLGESKNPTARQPDYGRVRNQIGAANGAPSDDPRLVALIEAWPTLPEPIRKQIEALVAEVWRGSAGCSSSDLI
jgi:hypothetical protein